MGHGWTYSFDFDVREVVLIGLIGKIINIIGRHNLYVNSAGLGSPVHPTNATACKVVHVELIPFFSRINRGGGPEGEPVELYSLD